MKYSNTIKRLLLIVILSIHLQARAADKIDFTNPLVSGFLRPPKAAKPSIYWLWLNGYVNRRPLLPVRHL